MPLPDYQGGSLVNLMTSITQALGGEQDVYPPLRALAAEPRLGSDNIVLLVIDGLGYHYLQRVAAGGALHGQVRGRMTSVFPSTTATAITTFLTGLAPQQHGLTGWHVYFKELGAVLAVLPFRTRHGAQLAEPDDLARSLFSPAPVFDRLRARSYVVTPARIADSTFNRIHAGSAERRPYSSLRALFTEVESILGAKGGRKYIYAYYPELDRAAHEFGIASGEARAELERIDHEFGRFLRRIAGSGTTVIATADHGFVDTAPERVIDLSRHAPLADALILPLCGDRRAAYCYVHPNRGEQFVEYVARHFADSVSLFESADLVARGYFGAGPAHPQLAARVGHYTLLPRENYAIKDWVPGENQHVQVGLHGGLSEDEMWVPLIVASP